MNNNLDEVWAYDEPHQSGGNCKITMTKQQAIEWMKVNCNDMQLSNDEEYFKEWVIVNLAYKEKTKDKRLLYILENEDE